MPGPPKQNHRKAGRVMQKAREKRQEQTRRKILAAARKLFSEKGYHKTQVMDVVRAVGMSAGTFYRHFRDKRQLYEEVSDEGIRNLRKNLRHLRGALDIWDPVARRERARESYEAFFDFVDQNPEQVMMILRGYGGHEGRTAMRLFLDIVKDLAEDAGAWTDQGVVEGLEPYVFAHAVMGMSLQVVLSYLVEKRFDREKAVTGLTRMFSAAFESYLSLKGRGVGLPDP